MISRYIAGALTVAVAAVALSVPAMAQLTPVFDALKTRGFINCGVSVGSPPFASADSKGVLQGIDADQCRALAAAVFGDPTKVKWKLVDSQTRFTALQSGEADVLYSGNTWTFTREARLGLLFTNIYYYDGQGFLVKKMLGVKSAKELDGASVCMNPGSTQEINSKDFFGKNKMKFTPVIIADAEEEQKAFLSGRCDTLMGDSSGLAGFRSAQGAKAADYVLLPEIISKEPLSGVVRKGDGRWFDIVRWTSFALVTAEELGITSDNIDTFVTSIDPTVRRLLGVEGDTGQALGIDNKWAYNAIKAVGNFGQMWERDVAPTGVQRGLNRQWYEGGLLYAPPLR
jgi:general L-amino acid transport system substrate-binding protein